METLRSRAEVSCKALRQIVVDSLSRLGFHMQIKKYGWFQLETPDIQ